MRRAGVRRAARRCRPTRESPRPTRGRRRRLSHPPAIAAAPRPTSAGVFGIARTTATPGPAAASSVEGDAGSDRQDPAGAGRHGAADRIGDTVGFHCDHRRRAARNLGDHLDAGEQLAELLAASVQLLDHGERRRVELSGREHPTEQRGTHVAATDHRHADLVHLRDRSAKASTGRPSGCGEPTPPRCTRPGTPSRGRQITEREMKHEPAPKPHVPMRDEGVPHSHLSSHELTSRAGRGEGPVVVRMGGRRDRGGPGGWRQSSAAKRLA